MKTNILIVTLLICFFAIPFLPWQLLMLTDLVLVRLILLVSFLAAVQISPITGILSLAIIALLFIERNKRKMNYVRSLMSQSSPNSPAIQSIQDSPFAPEQPPFDTPVEKNIPFSPQEDSGDNHFNPVAESLNQKKVLPTESANGSRFAVKQLFGWVDTKLVQE